MIVTKSGNILTATLDENEEVVIDHLTETRGVNYIQQQLNFWLEGRFATVREELKNELVKEEMQLSIKELKEKVKEKQDG